VAHVARPPTPDHLRWGSVHRGGQGGGQLPDRVGLAAGHVEHPGHRRGRLQRQQVGAGDVADVDEVAALAAVLQHLWCPPGREGAAEDGRDPGVGGVAGHPRAVDVVVAQRRDHRPARGHRHQRQLLLMQLGGGVDAARVGHHILGHWQRLQVPTATGAGRLEPARFQSRWRSRAGADRTMLEAPVATLAVDHHRAGQQQPVDPAGTPVQRAQQPRGSQGVVAHVVHHVAQVAAQPDHGRLVADRLDPSTALSSSGPSKPAQRYSTSSRR
jgi:hypothetical protein